MPGDVLVRPSDKWNDLALKFDAHVHVHVHGAWCVCICLGDMALGSSLMVVIYEGAKEVRDGNRTAHKNVFRRKGNE